MVHFFRCIRDNKTLGLKYYADMNDEPLSDLPRKYNINTKKQLMVFSDSSWKDCTDINRSTGACMIFYQGGPIGHVTHVPGPVDPLSAESEYNTAFIARIDLARFRMLTHELLKKDPYSYRRSNSKYIG